MAFSISSVVDVTRKPNLPVFTPKMGISLLPIYVTVFNNVPSPPILKNNLYHLGMYGNRM